jgi:kynurenine 3-monooxygenase
MKQPRFNYSQDYIDSGYKEVHIPAASDGSPQLNIDALHIWPRREFMLMGLANTDNGFTGTVFAPFGGEYGLDHLKTGADGMRYFEKYFKDAIPLIPDLEDQWENNPTSALVCIRCNPYHWGTNTMLIGDAAHATVPFYGEGMNGSLEDVRVFLELLDEHGDSDMKKVLEIYTEQRVPAGNALVDLSLRNFIEMRDLVADPSFQLRKKIERKVQANHPDKWTPLYTLVKFTNIPYHEAKAEGERHDRIMEEILAMDGIEERWDSEEVEQEVLRLFESVR